jgi:hypothetical protein
MMPAETAVIEAVASLADEPCTVALIAKDQPEYIPLPALVFPDGKIMTEWVLTEEERQRIADGENVRLWVWTFGHPLQPVCLMVTGGE